MTTPVCTLLAAILGIALATGAVAQSPIDLSPDEILKRADIDGDGKVSREEFIKSRTARLEQAFQRMDADGDGTLDAQEAEAAAEQMHSARVGGRGGFRRPDGTRPRPDGDGPSRPGAAALGEQAFDRFDGDGDGTLSREEFATGMGRMRGLMQRDGQDPDAPGRPVRGGRGSDEGFRRPPRQD